MFTSKTNIDDYIDNNELNSRIYDVLLYLHDDCQTCEQHQLKRPPLEIFNVAYAVCDELQQEKHPEEASFVIWDRLRNKGGFLLCETNIIFSCVFVILLFSEKKNPNIKHFFTRIKHKIDKNYFKEFEPLIHQELTYFAPTTTDFETLKNTADQIPDLNERELFLTDWLTRHRQAHNKGNIEQQVSDEIELIHTHKDLLDDEEENTNVASIKVRAFILLELLKKLGIDTARYDLSKICRAVALVAGTRYKGLYNELQKGIEFTDCHNKEINEAKKFFADLNISISTNKK